MKNEALFLTKLVESVMQCKLSLKDVQDMLSEKEWRKFIYLYTETVRAKELYYQITFGLLQMHNSVPSVVKNYSPIVRKYKDFLELTNKLKEITYSIKEYATMKSKMEYVESATSIKIIDLAIQGVDISNWKFEDKEWEKQKKFLNLKLENLKKQKDEIWNNYSVLERLNMRDYTISSSIKKAEDEVFNTVDKAVETNNELLLRIFNNIL